MAVQLNHTIVSAKDSRASARFLAEILDLPAPKRVGPFVAVQTDNGVSLDFIDTDDKIEVQHFAFLITEPEFDAIHARIRERKLPYWADPRQTKLNEINRWEGGRGLYFEDPNGHLMEVLTRPYGSGGEGNP